MPAQKSQTEAIILLIVHGNSDLSPHSRNLIPNQPDIKEQFFVCSEIYIHSLWL